MSKEIGSDTYSRGQSIAYFGIELFSRFEVDQDGATDEQGFTERALTYAQLATAIDHTAAGLAARGFKKGDVFAIYCPNIPEYAVAFNAVAKCGGINTTVNPLYTAEELTNQLKDSGARYLLTVAAFLDKAKEAAAASGIEEIFVVGDEL